MSLLREILETQATTVPLDVAALEVARIEFPELETSPWLDRLNELAARLGDRLRNFNDGRDFVENARDYLFGELGFRGNKENFFDPLNSCLNQVLENRTGIPITLSVVYIEVARRLKMPVFGVSLPRRFIVQYDGGNYSAFIDPYGGGNVVTPQECFVLAGAGHPDPNLLRRASQKEILSRMLQNLQGCYLRKGDLERTVQVLDLLMVGDPPDPSRYKLRGVLLLQLGRRGAARRDLERYLALEPAASDAAAVRKQLESIHVWLGRLN